MKLLRYLRSVNGLGDPKGSLSGFIPAQAIAQTNMEVENAVGSTIGEKCEPYTKYSATQRSDIAMYACQHGALEQQQPQDTFYTVNKASMK